MVKQLKTQFWVAIAKFILRNRIFILVILGAITIFLIMQWRHLRMTYTEANMLPENHPIHLEYQKFIEIFGEEGNLIVIGAETDKIFTQKQFKKWNSLTEEIQKFPQIEGVLSTHTMKELVKDTLTESFKLEPFFAKENLSDEELKQLKEKLFQKTPFYEGLLYNKEKNTLRMAISMKKDR